MNVWETTSDDSSSEIEGTCHLYCAMLQIHVLHLLEILNPPPPPRGEGDCVMPKGLYFER